MNAASAALKKCGHLFPHLSYQKKIVQRSFQRQDKERKKLEWQEEVMMTCQKTTLTSMTAMLIPLLQVTKRRKELGLDELNEKKWRERERKDNELKRSAEVEHENTDVVKEKTQVDSEKTEVVIKKRRKPEQLEEGECSDEDVEDVEEQQEVTSEVKGVEPGAEEKSVEEQKRLSLVDYDAVSSEGEM